MNTRNRLIATVVAVLMIGTGVLMIGAAVTQAEKGTIMKTSEPSQHQQDVRFLREEEKLARDVYITLHKRWKLQIFENISQSEQRHMDRMKTLVIRYGLTDPVRDDTVGVFTNKELAKLYKDLVARGSKSEVEALLVGATIEDLDIRDIRRMKKNTADADAQDAFAKLECGSRNHMRAFSRQLEARGVTYKVKYLSQGEVKQILEGAHERCGQVGRGGKQGRGQGHGRGGGHGWSKGQGRGHRGSGSCNHGN